MSNPDAQKKLFLRRRMLQIRESVARDAKSSARELLYGAAAPHFPLGFCVTLVKDGRTAQTYAFGEKSPGGEKVASDTRFRVASV